MKAHNHSRKSRKQQSTNGKVEITGNIDMTQLMYELIKNKVVDCNEIRGFAPDNDISSAERMYKGKPVPSKRRWRSDNGHRVTTYFSEEDFERFEKLKKLASIRSTSLMIRHVLFDVYEDLLKALAAGAKILLVQDGKVSSIEKDDGVYYTSIFRKLI